MLKGEGVISWPSLAEGDTYRLRNDSRSPPLTGGRESELRWARGSSKYCSKYCSKRSPSCTLRAKPRGARLVRSHAGVAARPSSQPAPQHGRGLLGRSSRERQPEERRRDFVSAGCCWAEEEERRLGSLCCAVRRLLGSGFLPC